MLAMLREAKASVVTPASSSADTPARARPASMCFAPLWPNFASENSFEALSEDGEELSELGAEPAAGPKPGKCAPRIGSSNAPRQPRRRRAKAAAGCAAADEAAGGDGSDEVVVGEDHTKYYKETLEDPRSAIRQWEPQGSWSAGYSAAEAEAPELVASDSETDAPADAALSSSPVPEQCHDVARARCAKPKPWLCTARACLLGCCSEDVARSEAVEREDAMPHGPELQPRCLRGTSGTLSTLIEKSKQSLRPLHNSAWDE